MSDKELQYNIDLDSYDWVAVVINRPPEREAFATERMYNDAVAAWEVIRSVDVQELANAVVELTGYQKEEVQLTLKNTYLTGMYHGIRLIMLTLAEANKIYKEEKDKTDEHSTVL